MTRLSLLLPRLGPAGELADGSTLCQLADQVEGLGFTGLWTTDALARDYASPDPLVVLAGIAARTERLLLGSSIVQLPIRDPTLLANQVQTLALFAPGRIRIGVGAGSNRADFVATGTEFAERFNIFSERVEILRRHLDAAPVGGVVLSGLGVPRPQLFLGTWRNPASIARAASEFDGWIASVLKTDWRSLEESLATYREAGGTNAIAVNLVVDARLVGRTDWSSGATMRVSNDDAPEVIERLSHLGFQEVAIRIDGHSQAALGRLAEVSRTWLEGS